MDLLEVKALCFSPTYTGPDTNCRRKTVSDKPDSTVINEGGFTTNKIKPSFGVFFEEDRVD